MGMKLGTGLPSSMLQKIHKCCSAPMCYVPMLCLSDLKLPPIKNVSWDQLQKSVRLPFAFRKLGGSIWDITFFDNQCPSPVRSIVKTLKNIPIFTCIHVCKCIYIYICI